MNPLLRRAPAVALGPPDSPISRSGWYGHGMEVSYDPTARAYVGVYSSPYVGTASVIEVDGQLKLRLGPEQIQFALDHFDGEVFSFTPPTASFPTAVTFTVDGGGTATSFEAEAYAPSGFGTWTRVPGAVPDTGPVPPNDSFL